MRYSKRSSHSMYVATLSLALLLLITACGGDGSTESTEADQGTPRTSTNARQTTPGESSSAPSAETAATTTSVDPASENQTNDASAAEAAPQFGTIDSWHNSDALTVDALRGSPVLLVFWADF